MEIIKIQKKNNKNILLFFLTKSKEQQSSDHTIFVIKQYISRTKKNALFYTGRCSQEWKIFPI